MWRTICEAANQLIHNKQSFRVRGHFLHNPRFRHIAPSPLSVTLPGTRADPIGLQTATPPCAKCRTVCNLTRPGTPFWTRFWSASVSGWLRALPEGGRRECPKPHQNGAKSDARRDPPEISHVSARGFQKSPGPPRHGPRIGTRAGPGRPEKLSTVVRFSHFRLRNGSPREPPKWVPFRALLFESLSPGDPKGV